MDNPIPPLDQPDIDGLVIKVQAGDSEAFSKLYDLLVDTIYRYIYFRANKEDVEDLTELVFVKVWEHIKKYRKDTVPFSAWVFRIAHNVVIDHYRTHRGLYELPEQIADDRREYNPKELTETQLHGGLLQEAMKHLKDRYQQVLVLRFINELNVEETALAMGLSARVVRVLQFRALQNLKKILKDRGISYL